MMRRGFLGVGVLIGGLLSSLSAAHAVVPTLDEPTAVLRALDKITARVEELNIPINQPYKFDTITITVRSCRVTPAEDTPEAAAFIEVSEMKPGEANAAIFRGWMFASSPALSAMEHPVYDIWVTGCKGPPTEVKTVDQNPALPPPDAQASPAALPPTPTPPTPTPPTPAPSTLVPAPSALAR